MHVLLHGLSNQRYLSQRKVELHILLGDNQQMVCSLIQLTHISQLLQFTHHYQLLKKKAIPFIKTAQHWKKAKMNTFFLLQTLIYQLIFIICLHFQQANWLIDQYQSMIHVRCNWRINELMNYTYALSLSRNRLRHRYWSLNLCAEPRFSID